MSKKSKKKKNPGIAGLSGPPTVRKLKVLVSPKDIRLHSLMIYRLDAHGGRQHDGRFVVFDAANEGEFAAIVGSRYEFDWHLKGAAKQAIELEFKYPDATTAAKVEKKYTEIEEGRTRSYGVGDLPMQGVIV